MAIQVALRFLESIVDSWIRSVIFVSDVGAFILLTSLSALNISDRLWRLHLDWRHWSDLRETKRGIEMRFWLEVRKNT